MSYNSATPPTIGLLCTTLNVRSVASHWTEADKEKFLILVQRNGLDDLEALADALGTKSDQEVDFFLALLHEHLGRQYLQAFINAQPANQSNAKQNTLLAKLLESVMSCTFQGHVQRLLANATAADPDALFALGGAAGGGGADRGKMGGVGRRRVAAPVPKKGYTKRKREEQAKEEAARKREEQAKEEAAKKKRAKNNKKMTTVEAGEEEGEEKKEEEKNEEEASQEQPEPGALASAPAKAEQQRGQEQVMGGVQEEEEEEEEEEEVVEAGVYEENDDDWEPVTAPAAVGPMEETKQNVEEEGQKVE